MSATWLDIPHLGLTDLRTLLDYQLAQLLRQQEGVRGPDAGEARATIEREIKNRTIRKGWREEGQI